MVYSEFLVGLVVIHPTLMILIHAIMKKVVLMCKMYSGANVLKNMQEHFIRPESIEIIVLSVFLVVI